MKHLGAVDSLVGAAGGEARDGTGTITHDNQQLALRPNVLTY